MGRNGDTWYLSTEDLKKILRFQYQQTTCTDCSGKGWVWVDGQVGEEVVGPDPSRDPSDYYQDVCDECHGLGAFVMLND